MNFDVKDNDEGNLSERPALEQLVKMGYQYLSQKDLNKTRRAYSEVLLYDRLERAIRKLNPDLYEESIRDVLHQIEEETFPRTMEHLDANEMIRAKLVCLSRSGGLEPITVIQDFGNGPEEKTVRLFDFDNPENNDFVVTNQFELQGFKEPIYPDIVVFVNGIPLVIIECKSPTIRNPIEEAVEKNFRKYQSPELGYDRLFFYNHFLVATSGQEAKHGTLGANVNHYAKWSEAYPLTEEQIREKFGKAREQEILIAGMLDKAHLLDLLKNYVIYEVVNNRKVKKIAKHQQYRVVTKAVDRLNLKQEIADKGGVIWHTQGSGKSLSMLFFATQLMYKFGNPPILIVTDRKQLDDQIQKTFKQCGFPDPIRAERIEHLKSLLVNPQGKAIMTTIQKFREFGGFHTDAKIIALVDEAHRTQYKVTASSMRNALPNAVFFAFTGTPIDKKNKSTYRVFGPMIDKYSFEESKVDGATLPIMYEDRMPELFVEGGDTIDQIFERVFSDLDEKTKTKLKKQYVTKEKIAEAPSRVKKICLDLVEHYTKTIEPNGYKAMLVVSSREAAVTYKRELDRLNAPPSKIIMTSHLGEKGKDGSSWDQYYLTADQREHEAERFKTPEDPTKILIVVDMLLVGYDVPIVQVLYLDNPVKEHNLLQAIARVNRPYDVNKKFGLIVDYCGITKELQKALAIFEEDDIKGALESTDKQLQDLKLRHVQAMSYFSEIDMDNDEEIIINFEPSAKREQFEYDYKQFASALDAVLPKKEAQAYTGDFKKLSKIRYMIRNKYEGYGVSLREYGGKVQQMIDDYIRSGDIEKLQDRKEITYENFFAYVAGLKSERAKTALVKNRARQVIEESAQYNPAYYERLREKLERIIKEEEERRRTNANYFTDSKIYQAIIDEAQNEQKERESLGFSSRFEFAVYGELQSKFDDGIAKATTKKIYKQIEPETRIVGWKSKANSERKIGLVVYDILQENRYPEDKIEEMITKILDLAKRLIL